MREKTTNGQVIIVYTEHPVFGILLIPYIAERLENGTLQLIEQAFHASPEAIEQMNEAERQAIDIASHYTEKYLMGAYSREKTVSRFLHKLSQDPEKVKNNIRPFIEGKLLEMLTLIRENGLSFIRNSPEAKCCTPTMLITYIHMTPKSALHFMSTAVLSAINCNVIMRSNHFHWTTKNPLSH